MDVGLTEDRALLVRAPTALLLGGEGSLAPELRRGTCQTLTVALNCHIQLLIRGTEEKQVRIITGTGHFAEEEKGAAEWQGTVEAIRAAVHYFGLEEGMCLEVMAEVPPHAGIGSQAAALIAAVKGLALWSGLNLNPPEVASIAVEVARPLGEAGLLTAYLYASAFGGIHRLRRRLGSKGRPAQVEMEAVGGLPPATLERMGLLFLPPQEAQRHAPLTPLWVNPETAESRRRRNESRIPEIEAAWQAGEAPRLARLLDATSGLEETAFVDPPVFGRAYRLAKREGAWGGFLAQDGAGSSLLVLAAQERHPAIRAQLGELGLRARPLRLERRRFAAFAVEPWQKRRIIRRGVASITRYG